MNFKNIIFLNIIKKLFNLKENLLKNLFFSSILVALIFSIVFSIFFWNRQENYSILYNNLSLSEASYVLKKLKEMNISYKFNKNPKNILVPDYKVNDLQLYFSDKNIDHQKINGFELIDQEKFGISRFKELLNYHRGLEGELSKTLCQIYPIKTARVHLVIEKKSDFFHKENISSASVVVGLFSGEKLSSFQIDAIKNFLSFSVPSLSIDKITLIDQNSGILLNSSIFSSNKSLKNVEYVENYYHKLISDILTKLFGKENYNLTVRANSKFLKNSKRKKKIYNNTDEKKFFLNIKKIFNIYQNDLFFLKNFSTVFTVKNLSFLNSIKQGNFKNKVFYKNFSKKYKHTINFLKFFNVNNLFVSIIINNKGNRLFFSPNKIKFLKNLICSAIGLKISKNFNINIFNLPFYQKKKIKNFSFFKNFLIKKNNFFIVLVVLILFILFLFFFIFFRKFIQLKNFKNLFNTSIDNSSLDSNKNKNIKNISNSKNVPEKKVFKENKNILNNFNTDSIPAEIISDYIRHWIHKK